MNTLLFLLITMMSQTGLGFLYPEFAVKTYPEIVMPGDTLYMTIVARNPHEKSIYISNGYIPQDDDIKLQLKDSADQTQPLLFEGSEDEWDCDYFLEYAEIPSSDSRFIGALAINVPPLEDLKEPFWEKHLHNLSVNGEKLTFCCTILSFSSADEKGESEKYRVLPFTLEIPLVVKPRPEKEMALIRKWYDNTPKELLPVLFGQTRKAVKGRIHFLVKTENVFVKGKPITQMQFIRFGNRYPGYPNAPETWQGWKELEDSLTPSTMRDEIRMARILIQYCDTEDDAVLEELKEWFAGMNVVQRTVMAQNIRFFMWFSRPESYNTGMLESFEKIYGTIKEYDIPAHANYKTQYLKDVGLLE